LIDFGIGGEKWELGEAERGYREPFARRVIAYGSPSAASAAVLSNVYLNITAAAFMASALFLMWLRSNSNVVW
jgi:hypothetical protein